MNSKQIIITFITLITLIGAGWYCYRKFKPSTPNSTNGSQTNIKKCIDQYGNKVDVEYNTNNKIIKQTTYQKRSNTIKQIDEYTDNEKLIKSTHYQRDGQTIAQIHEYNENEKLVKAKHYQPNGRTIEQIDEYNENGQNTKATEYYPDGQTIKQNGEYENGILIKKTEYNTDKTIKNIEEYNPVDGQPTKTTEYNLDRTIKKITEFNPDGSVKK